MMVAVVLAAEGTSLWVAILTGGIAGAAVTSILGPFFASREARIETYRKWQVDLSTEFLDKVAALRLLLADQERNRFAARRYAKALDELDTLAQRVSLIFMAKLDAPKAARRVVETARKRGADLKSLDEARDAFVEHAGDEIRSRHLLRAWKRTISHVLRTLARAIKGRFRKQVSVAKHDVHLHT